MHSKSSYPNGLDAPATLLDLPLSARSLVERALALVDPKYGFSTASVQIYDTAWVAMVTKTTCGQKNWLFPECFHYLLGAQAPDGGWGADNASQTAGIVDTAAALLALLKHAAEPLQIQDHAPAELARRICLATQSLSAQLVAWNDVAATNHISVEFVVPALLQYLKEEDPSLLFTFETQTTLARMSAAKLALFHPEVVYGQRSSPLVYALEAFIGKIDFDKISHQRFRNGSMWTSPAATAAYLMGITSWDDEAEAYLRHVIKAGQGHGAGGVPGTFPTHLFELNWVVGTLLHSGFAVEDLGVVAVDGISSIVKQAFAEDGGVIGHAPQAIDADDAAKGMLALRLLGKEDGISPDVLIKLYEREDGFSTFGGERDRSLSTNCNILCTLLAWNQPLRYAEAIRKAAGFISEYWWNFIGPCKDKWHLSPLYPRMLMTQGFAELLRLLDANPASDLLDGELKTKMSIALFQAGIRTILEQRENGSWEDSPEQTAYAILTLVKARHLCFFAGFVDRLRSSISSGISYLIKCDPNPATDRFWTSKTKYSVKLVSEAYILAALYSSVATDGKGEVGRAAGLQHDFSAMGEVEILFSRTKQFSTMPDWLLWASIVESALWLPLLRARRIEIFPRDQPISKEAYFNLLPALWTACKYRSMKLVPNTFIYDMLFMTLVNIQVDEFIEGAVTSEFQDDIQNLHLLIDEITDAAIRETADGSHATNGTHSTNGTCVMNNNDLSTHLESKTVSEVLSQFALHVLGHGARASANDRRSLEREFRSFLHTQTRQMEDNTRFRRQEQGRGQMFAAPLSYFEWVRTIAADHVSTPFSWAWVCCWSSSNLGKGAQVFGTPAEGYLAAATARHLATTNRMYNDLGSVTRDTAECNLNSIHFPEFNNGSAPDVGAQKLALKSLAEYEHGCVTYTRHRLEEEVKRTHPNALESSFERQKLYTIGLLCDVGSLWDSLYALRDLSSSIPHRSSP